MITFERLIVCSGCDIEKYIAFRFESFVVVTPDEEKKYYRDDVRAGISHAARPGVLVPTFEQKQAEIHETLTQQKVAAVDRALYRTRRSSASRSTSSTRFDRRPLALNIIVNSR